MIQLYLTEFKLLSFFHSAPIFLSVLSVSKAVWRKCLHLLLWDIKWQKISVSQLDLVTSPINYSKGKKFLFFFFIFFKWLSLSWLFLLLFNNSAFTYLGCFGCKHLFIAKREETVKHSLVHFRVVILLWLFRVKRYFPRDSYLYKIPLLDSY